MCWHERCQIPGHQLWGLRAVAAVVGRTQIAVAVEVGFWFIKRLFFKQQLRHVDFFSENDAILPIGSMVLPYMVTWIPSIYPQC